MPTPLRNAWRRPRSDVYAKLSLQGVLAPYGVNAHSYWPGDGARWGVAASNLATVDNPVGLSLDALQAMTLGSELVTNGTNLVSTTGWTATALSGAPASLSVSAGSLVVTNAGTTYGVAAQTVAVTAGKTYLVSARLTKGTAAAANIRVGSTAFGYEYVDQQAATGGTVPITCVFKATSGSVFISLLNANTTDGTGAYNNISVREIPGIHATQATTANKPILRRGLLNLIAYSDDQSNAAWTNANLNVTPGQASSPYGTSDSALLAPTAVSGSHVLYQNNVTIARNVTMAFIAKAGVLQFLSPSNAGAGVLTSTFDLVAGTSANGASTTSSMVSLGGGWWLGAMSFTAAYTAASFYINNSGSASIASFAGNGTDGLYMYRAGLFDGTYTAQQILDAGGIPLTTTAAASNPRFGRYWAQFDGANDLMGLDVPPFQLGDDHCVLAYCLPTLSGALQVLVSPSYSDASNYAGLLGIDATGKPFAEWSATTGGARRITGPGSITGQGTLLACRKVGNTKTLWVNGTLVGSDFTAQAGSVAASAYLGSWNGSSLYYQGYLGPSVLIKGAVSDASLADIYRLIQISQL